VVARPPPAQPALREYCHVRLACRIAGVDGSLRYHKRATDAAFATEWKDAIEEGCDRLEEEARRRALGARSARCITRAARAACIFSPTNS